MSCKPAHSFSQLVSERDPDIQIAHENANWEHEQVKHLLRRCAFSADTARRLSDLSDKRFGDRNLRFEIFNEEYQDFPFALRAHRLRGMPTPYRPGETSRDYHVHTDPHCFEPARFKKFEWVPYVLAFREFERNAGKEEAGRNLALTFPRKGFARGMVIHNDVSEQYWDDGLCWVYKEPGDVDRRLYVQPYNALLVGIHRDGRGWRPS